MLCGALELGVSCGEEGTLDMNCDVLCSVVRNEDEESAKGLRGGDLKGVLQVSLLLLPLLIVWWAPIWAS